MVNISKFSGLASKTLKFLKPSTRKVVIGLGSIYGATVGIGVYLGDKEHREKIENYKYVPPKIGEDGIVKADTLNLLDGTKCIHYCNKDNQLVQSTNYDNNGKMSGFRIYTSDSGDYNGFNAKGEFTSSLENNADGSYTYAHKDAELGQWLEDKYDKNNRLTHYESVIDGKVESGDMTYHKDGSKTHKFSLTNNAITRDKNDKIIKEKQYDDNGVLKYTVVPKYNKDGDVIKNDTIRNNQ